MSKFPSRAKRVFKGILFEVWQWKQKMYDGKVTTFERIKRSDSVQVIAMVGSKLIVQKQEQPHVKSQFLSLPGGRADGGGTPLAEAKRELLEETGCISNDWTLWKKSSPSTLILSVSYIFIAKNCKRIAAPNLDGGEKIKNTFVSFKNFLRLSEDPKFRGSFELINELLKIRLNSKRIKKFKKLLF